MKIHRPSVEVRESFNQAKQQAAAMDSGPPTPWNAVARARARSPRWIGLAITSVVASGAAGWLGADWLSGPTVATASSNAIDRTGGAARADQSAAAVAPGAERSVSPQPAPAVAPIAARTDTAMALAQSSLDVKREAGLIHIASNNASLAEVVRVLAQATRTSVKGGEALASIASPITLHWQGRDTAAAWDALLGRFANIAVSCGGAGCELWVVGVNTPRTAPGSAVSASTTTSNAAQPPRVVPQDSPPSDENTETN